MKHFYIFLTLILICHVTMAQDQQYLVKGGTRPKDVFKFTDLYLYPSFTSGKVYFKNDHFGGGLLNYNRFTGELDFIKEKDTLALADQELIKNVLIGSDVFYYQVEIGCIQRIAQTSYATLAKREYMEVAGQKRHPNSATASTTSNGSYNGMITTGAGLASGLSLNMVEKVDLIYKRKTGYYFANSKFFFVEANKKNILSIFRDKKNLNTYLEEHPVDFGNAESLQNLFTAINEMQ